MIAGLYGVSLCLLMPSVLSTGGFGELSELGEDVSFPRSRYFRVRITQQRMNMNEKFLTTAKTALCLCWLLQNLYTEPTVTSVGPWQGSEAMVSVECQPGTL